jgi:predicted DsbA family dithiol-disulfide isomerase
LQFEHEQNLGDEEVLVAAATAAGLNGTSAQAYLRSGDGIKTIDDEVREYMTRYSVSGVPFFIIQLHEGAPAHSITADAASSPTGEVAQVQAAGSSGVVCSDDGVCAVPTRDPTPVPVEAASSVTAPTPDAAAHSALTGRYTANGAQEVDYFTQMFEHLWEEGNSKKGGSKA